jgi:hypothetical protein
MISGMMGNNFNKLLLKKCFGKIKKYLKKEMGTSN